MRWSSLEAGKIDQGFTSPVSPEPLVDFRLGTNGFLTLGESGDALREGIDVHWKFVLCDAFGRSSIDIDDARVRPERLYFGRSRRRTAGEYVERGCTVDASEIFVSDGSKWDNQIIKKGFFRSLFLL